jgi:PTH1 family peptidyl-tRNA hydrolase
MVSRKFLIAGLGNIGAEYEGTRHNIGFEIADRIASVLNISFTVARYASIAEGSYKGRSITLIKPSTYMNLSGKAVRYHLMAAQIGLDNLIVIADDLSLPVCKLRIRLKGSHGGHNGLRDIEAALNSQEYPRLRFGIGMDFPMGAQVNYVLGKWRPEDQIQLEETRLLAAQAVLDMVAEGYQNAMTKYNSNA